MKRHRMLKTWPFVGVLATSSVLGCGAEEPNTEDLEERIIGGFPLRAKRFDAIGALGFPLAGPEPFDAEDPGVAARRPYLKALEGQPEIEDEDTHFPFCSGTLIAPNAVLTAEHCVQDLFGDEEFLIGFDGTSPDRAIRIAGVVVEDSIEGGILGLGSDVAVAILEESVEDIEPIAYGVLTEEDVGRPLFAAGYGWRNNLQEGGQRYVGQMKLRGIGGNHALNVWETLEEYIAQFPNLLPDYGLGDDPEAALPFFDLLDEYEVSVGNSPGNAQACRGDSGGPIAKSKNGELTVYGVRSAAVGTYELTCDWGTVYATLGPAALDMVDAAVGCGLVPVEGTCDGDIAMRCAPPEEGGYEVVQSDCSLFGLICGQDEAGEIGCIPDPCEGIPAEGTCEGDVAVRCSLPGEGPRRVVQTDCSLIGGTCGLDEAGEVSCVGVSTASCEGNCGGAAEGPDGSACFCDESCVEFGDCCDDYAQWCEPVE